MTDQIHRKLTDTDYSRMRWDYDHNFTIREIAGAHMVSTKFVNKVLQAQISFTESGTVHFVMNSDYKDNLVAQPIIGSQWNCSSGCGRYFSTETDLNWHIGFYSESGAHQLTCTQFMAGHVSK